MALTLHLSPVRTTRPPLRTRLPAMPLAQLIEQQIAELDRQIADMLDAIRAGNATREILTDLRLLTAQRSDGYDMLAALGASGR